MASEGLKRAREEYQVPSPLMISRPFKRGHADGDDCEVEGLYPGHCCRSESIEHVKRLPWGATSGAGAPSSSVAPPSAVSPHCFLSLSSTSAQTEQPHDEDAASVTVVGSVPYALPVALGPPYRAEEEVDCSVDYHDDGGGHLSLTGQKLSIEVVRGDTGARLAFIGVPCILLSWKRQNDFYRSVDGDPVGYELQELVRIRVLRHQRPAATKRCRPRTPVSFDEENEEATGPRTHWRDSNLSRSLPALTDAEVGEGSVTDMDRSYSYEAGQVSRILHPPSLPMRSSSPTTSTQWFSPHTQGLLVDCVLKCVVEEARLLDGRAWVFLYAGAHVLSERGRNLLAEAVARMCFSPGHTGLITPLSICAFRKC